MHWSFEDAGHCRLPVNEKSSEIASKSSQSHSRVKVVTDQRILTRLEVHVFRSAPSLRGLSLELISAYYVCQYQVLLTPLASGHSRANLAQLRQAVTTVTEFEGIAGSYELEGC